MPYKTDGKVIPMDKAFTHRGVQYPIFRSIPSSIAGMYVYESVKKYLNSD